MKVEVEITPQEPKADRNGSGRTGSSEQAAEEVSGKWGELCWSNVRHSKISLTVNIVHHWKHFSHYFNLPVYSMTAFTLLHCYNNRNYTYSPTNFSLEDQSGEVLPPAAKERHPDGWLEQTNCLSFRLTRFRIIIKQLCLLSNYNVNINFSKNSWSSNDTSPLDQKYKPKDKYTYIHTTHFLWAPYDQGVLLHSYQQRELIDWL